MERLKKALFVLGLFTVFFAVTNPTPDNFSNYKGKFDEGKRTGNFLIFSTYESTGEKYVGFVFNFFKLGEPGLESESITYVEGK
jgi:hypothetical protein